MSMISAGLSVAAQMEDRANFPILPLPPGSFFVSEVLDNLAWYGTVVVSPPMGGPVQGVPLEEPEEQEPDDILADIERGD